MYIYTIYSLVVLFTPKRGHLCILVVYIANSITIDIIGFIDIIVLVITITITITTTTTTTTTTITTTTTTTTTIAITITTTITTTITIIRKLSIINFSNSLLVGNYDTVIFH